MTNKEAIEKLKEEFCKLKLFCELYPDECNKENCEIYLAISALEGKGANVSNVDTIVDTISRQAAIDALDCINGVEEVLRSLPSAQPNRELIDDYMWKIKQNISPHTAADGVIAIKYYLEQIYEQIYGKGEKPKWMI